MNNRKKSPRRVLQGLGLVGGLVYGKVLRLGQEEIDFPKYWISDTDCDGEVGRFYKAIRLAKRQIQQIKARLCHIQGREQIQILDSMILLIDDELLVKNTILAIQSDYINVEWAFHNNITDIKGVFSKMQKTHLREKKYDIDFIENAILSNLMGRMPHYVQDIPKDSIVVADSLSPADTLHLFRAKIRAFVTETGGIHSHMAIMARSMDIPSVIGVEGIAHMVTAKDVLLVDGRTGSVVVSPHAREMEQAKRERIKQLVLQQSLKKAARKAALTRDNKSIKVMANIELLSEVDLVREFGADGVGLFRTEFLFLDREHMPSVEEQFKTYSQILKKLAPREVIMRTVDLGADKLNANPIFEDQANPALGLRAIRYCLYDRGFFKDQLRALIMASTTGNLKICLPMISTLEEVQKVQQIIKSIQAELRHEGVDFSGSIPLGVMIETPAACLEADLLAREVDFFSVGTNDLVQYLLAVDRNNELVSDLYSPLHPSVMRALERIIIAARELNREVTLCGEIASDPVYLPLLIAMGFESLSMNMAAIPKIKSLIRRTETKMAQELWRGIARKSTKRDMLKYLSASLKTEYPEYF